MTPHQDGPARFQTALIVDDHPLFLDALSMTLKAVIGIRHIDTADHLAAAMALLEGGAKPDVVVLDLNLPDVSGLDGLVRLQGAAGDVPVVVVSSLTDARVIGAAIRAGAAGFVPKHSGRELFRTAFETVQQGRTFVPEGILLDDDQETPASETDAALERLASLTVHQARILELICEGKQNKQIAYDLSIAETTVKAHVTAIMRKLGVQSRTQAVLLAGQASFGKLLRETS
ncbi:response regulator transcription factor [Pontivivens ytuae]|uniref:Response regulator transcription factor n=1 Tax=Pontivivens ytuae TaxID=2789856 RepID=A0A7S9LRB0_9RHOB|nr:response regulator transcription factor [Pontivivens ytuae]QPH53659.1 response regulator transcription factor [Pontivivens ytuae]